MCYCGGMKVEDRTIEAISDFSEAAKQRLRHTGVSEDLCAQLRDDALLVAENLAQSLPCLRSHQETIARALLEVVDSLAA